MEEYKHGILSGLLIFKKLTYFLETDYALENNTLTCEDLRQFHIRKEILRAICGHTCPKIYHINLNTVSFLLILCDELQESGRPRLEELLIRPQNPKDPVESKINKFNISESTSIIKAEILYKDIDLNDNLDRQSKYEEGLIRKKFQHFHYLLRSAKQDSDREVDFLLELNFSNTKKYVFHFDSKKSSYDGMIESYSEESNGKNHNKFDLYPDPDPIQDVSEKNKKPSKNE